VPSIVQCTDPRHEVGKRPVTLTSRVLARAWSLPPAHSRSVRIERGLRVPMPDGVELLADRYVPHGDDRAPTILVRTPYRRRVFGLFARIFAERGYQVVVQNTRGTFGSAGVFDAFRDEERDGRATLEWLAGQPWFGSSAAMYGLSYLGLTQWAVAAAPPPWLRALSIQVSASTFHTLLYPGGSFGLNGALTWISLMQIQELPTARLALRYLGLLRRLPRAFATLPLRDADRVAVGTNVAFFQQWLVHTEPDDPYWATIDYSQRLEHVHVPVNLVAGWHDIFLHRQLADYEALRRAGQSPYLTVGPWVHRSMGMVQTGVRESLAWFDAHLKGEHTRLRPWPVRVFVMGARRWLDLPDWPPPADPIEWFLQPGARLARQKAPNSPPDHYVYDPAAPTPSVGGPLLAAARAVYDNRRLESRRDVLTYTSPALERDLTIIGDVEVDLHVSSSQPVTDFFARLCDVEPGGRSLNVTDAIRRVHGQDWPTCTRIALAPTAYCFRRGHRLRLQVSSGAFPRFSRAPGTPDPLGEAVELRVAHQQVLHAPAHASVVRMAQYTPPTGKQRIEYS
jgi:uncharacterized protein